MIPFLFWSPSEISKTIWEVKRHRKWSAPSNHTSHSNPSASATLPRVLFTASRQHAAKLEHWGPEGVWQLSNQRHRTYGTSPRPEIPQGNPLPPVCGTDGLQSSGWAETEATLPHSSPPSVITALSHGRRCPTRSWPYSWHLHLQGKSALLPLHPAEIPQAHIAGSYSNHSHNAKIRNQMCDNREQSRSLKQLSLHIRKMNILTSL